MSPWKILFRYVARQFLAWCAGVFLAMLTIAFLLDYLELIRRAGTRPEATLLVLLEMAALKQPHMAQEIMPFAMLFGTMMAFYRLTRTNELVVARAAGISVWQFLTPPLIGAFLIGALAVGVFNPVASVTQARYEQLENRIMRGGNERMVLSPSGFWLRQADETGDHSIVHAERFQMREGMLKDVMILFLANDAKLSERIDAASARLLDGRWEVNDGTRWEASKPEQTVPFETLSVATNLTSRKIQESFASPETMSFWELPGFIRLLEISGFPAQRHQLYFDGLLARPFLFMAMVLIAASFSLRMQRRGGTSLMIAGGVASGFLLYFFSSVVFALGLSLKIPTALAAWTPAGVSWFLGAALLLHLEDG
jgi:lipopolysaccharide export system permease protein